MKPPAFQFYAADFLVGTAAMTAEEVGAYIRLLCYQWDTGSVPDDDGAIMRLGGCQALAVAKIRQKFRKDDDGLRNERLEIERLKQKAFREKQAENGAKRWGGNAKPQGLAKPTHKPNACSPSSSPSSDKLLTELGESAAPSAPSPKVSGSAVRSEMTDADWLKGLSSDPAYVGLSIETEWAKMVRWCEVNRKQPTRKRFVNWLNRCERPMGQFQQQPPRPKAMPEPANWRAFVADNMPTCPYAPGQDKDGCPWTDVAPDHQRAIVAAMKDQADAA